MTRFFFAFMLGCLAAAPAVLALDSSLSQGLSDEELNFCQGKVAKAPAAEKASTERGCLLTRQLLRKARSCRAGDYNCVGPVSSEVGITYGMSIGEKALIIDLRLGNFFSPLL